LEKIAYKSSVNRTIEATPSEMVRGARPLSNLDYTPLPHFQKTSAKEAEMTEFI